MTKQEIIEKVQQINNIYVKDDNEDLLTKNVISTFNNHEDIKQAVSLMEESLKQFDRNEKMTLDINASIYDEFYFWANNKGLYEVEKKLHNAK